MNEYTMNVAGVHKEIIHGQLSMGGTNPSGESIGFTNYSMQKNGEPYYTISGEFHFSRYDEPSWEREILKIKACGLDTIATYMFWIHHEFYEGKFDFSGNRNIRQFISLCAKHNLQVILRVGPYAHGECRNGGLPDWMFGRPFEVRSNDEGYLTYVRRYFNEIGNQVHGLMYSEGGPVTAIQLENEYTAACSPWEITVPWKRQWITHGNGGLEHMLLLREIAHEAGLKTPYITCTGWGNAPYPDGEMLPLWGGYAYWPWLYWDNGNEPHPPTHGYLFKNHHDENEAGDYDKKYPFACCEMGGGMQVWYPYRFVAEPESVEAMSLVTIAGGCNFLGYFMFHGGRNPVIDGHFLNEQLNPRISYDFQAPVGEFGQLKESYRCIKNIHYMLRDHNNFFCTAAPVIPPQPYDPENTTHLRYAARSNGQKGFLFINNYQDHLEQTDKTGIRVQIQTNDGTIHIPHEGGMDILKNVSAVLPFNLDMGEILLEYSTAQYITRVDNNGKSTYFFFTPSGMTGEFCFSGKPDITGAGVTGRFTDGLTIVTLADKPVQEFNVGESICIVCLNREQSLDFWTAEIHGQQTAFLCEETLYSAADALYIECHDKQEISLLAYPPLNCGTSEFETKGIFTQYKFNCTAPDTGLRVETPVAASLEPYENRAIIHFDKSILDECTEVFLNVKYTGDIGWAFINGQLIHDNFNNGQTWEIGLKSLKNQLDNGDLYLYLSPLSEDGDVNVEGKSTYASVTAKDGTAFFDSITMSVVNQVKIPL